MAYLNNLMNKKRIEYWNRITVSKNTGKPDLMFIKESLASREMRLLSLLIVILALTAVAFLPLGVILAQEANPSRTLPDAVHRGETFDVTVTFNSPVDDFNGIGLTDLCPDGWEVTLDEAWCTPDAEFIKATDNKAEIMWFGPYESGTTVSALYKVTVADDASLGIYAFNGSVEYYVGEEGPFMENMTGGSQLEVVEGSSISVWWIVGIVVVIAIIVAAVLLVRRRRA